MLTRKRAILPLVVGLNQVDTIVPGGWDERLNMPTKEAEKEIETRCQALISGIARHAKISRENIEYYSAEKRYRLYDLLTKIVKFAHTGFKLGDVQPKNPFDLADAEIQQFAAEAAQKRRPAATGSFNLILDQLRRRLSGRDYNTIMEKLDQERAKIPVVAILGQAGVGKSTTINNLFNVDHRVSHTSPGTRSPLQEEFKLVSGGSLKVIDLPGYGRTLEEDAEYTPMYERLVPTADLVLLVVKANERGSMVDDEIMIQKLASWLEITPP